eukprot:767862-Hanusia_phi.AAC.3
MHILEAGRYVHLLRSDDVGDADVRADSSFGEPFPWLPARLTPFFESALLHRVEEIVYGVYDVGPVIRLPQPADIELQGHSMAPSSSLL